MYLTECLKQNKGISEAYNDKLEYNSLIKKLRTLIKDQILQFHFTNLFRLLQVHGDDAAIKKEFDNVFKALSVANEIVEEVYKNNTGIYWLRRIKELIRSALDEFGETKRIWDNPDEYDASSQLIPSMLNRVYTLLEDVSKTFDRELVGKEKDLTDSH